MPSLREHAEDIPELLEYHADRLQKDENFEYHHFTVASQNLLRYHHCPDNIVESRTLDRLILATWQFIEVELTETEGALHNLRLWTECGYNESFMGYRELFEFSHKDPRERFEWTYLSLWLTEMDDNISRPAGHAGIERTHLYRWGIEHCKERRKRT